MAYRAPRTGGGSHAGGGAAFWRRRRQRRGPGPGFLRAWRGLARSSAPIALRPWLHRIAHREFLRAARTRPSPVSLTELAEAAAPDNVDWTDAVVLREAIRKLPCQEREIVVLHYLQGYNSTEISQIMQVPAGTVRYRLSLARERLERELGEGDLTYLNEPAAPGGGGPAERGGRAPGRSGWTAVVLAAARPDV